MGGRTNTAPPMTKPMPPPPATPMLALIPIFLSIINLVLGQSDFQIFSCDSYKSGLPN